MSTKAIFLDRDNTLIEDPGYINTPEQVKLLPGVAQALIDLKKMGYLLIITTNQSAIARGIVTEEGLDKIHQRLKELLALNSAYIDKIYYCPYHVDGVIPKYRRESDLRKPNPGMLLTAARELDIDLSQSWMVGNSINDIAAGRNAGCRTILINSYGPTETPKPGDPVPDKKAVNMKEAVNIIKMLQRQTTPAVIPIVQNEPKEPDPEPEPELETEEPIPASEQNADEQDMQMETIYTDEPVEQQSFSRTEQSESPESTAEEKQDIETQDQQHSKTHQLLQEIITHLKIAKREELFEEFSSAKLFSGVAQAIVLFCLLISFWFFMDKDRPASSVHTMIGYAVVFQIMAVTFYIMRTRK